MADFLSRFKDELCFAGGVTTLGLVSAGAIWLARKKRKTPEHIHDISEINFGFNGPVTFIGKARNLQEGHKIYERELFTVMEKSTGDLVDKQRMKHKPSEALSFCLKDRSGEVCFHEIKRTSVDFDPYPHYARQEEYDLHEIQKQSNQWQDYRFYNGFNAFTFTAGTIFSLIETWWVKQGDTLEVTLNPSQFIVQESVQLPCKIALTENSGSVCLRVSATDLIVELNVEPYIIAGFLVGLAGATMWYLRKKMQPPNREVGGQNPGIIPRGLNNFDSSQDEPSRQDSEACKVCLQNKAKITYSRCGHLCICIGCHNALWQREGMSYRCPMCRQPIGRAVRTYLNSDE